LVTALSDQHAVSAIAHRVQQVHARVDSPAVQDHADHRAMANVHNVVLSMKARLVQDWSSVAIVLHRERHVHLESPAMHQQTQWD
jgi:hypothetical protein